MAVRITRAGVGLTVGIIILALVVLGGLYLVRERGEQARRDDAVEIAQENAESEAGETGTLTPTVIDGNEEAGEEASPAESTANNTKSDTSEESTATPGELPATGPSDIAGLLILGLLSFMAVSYMSSRRALTNVQ